MAQTQGSSSADVAEPPEPAGGLRLPKPQKTRKSCERTLQVKTYQLNGSIPSRESLEELFLEELMAGEHAQAPYVSHGGANVQVFYLAHPKWGEGLASLQYQDGKREWCAITRCREGYSWKPAEFFIQLNQSERTINYGIRVRN